MSIQLRTALVAALAFAALATTVSAAPISPRPRDLARAARARQRCPGCQVTVTADEVNRGDHSIATHQLTIVHPDGRSFDLEDKINHLGRSGRTDQKLTITRAGGDEESVRTIEWNNQDATRVDTRAATAAGGGSSTRLTRSVQPLPDGSRRVSTSTENSDVRILPAR